MNRHPLPQKNPTIAGVLSFVIPGAGQFYNEQIGKGIFILFALLGSFFLIFVGHALPWYRFPSLWSNQYIIGPIYPQEFFYKVYPFLWFFLFLPAIWLFGILDAVFSAKELNRTAMGVNFQHGYTSQPAAPASMPTPNPSTQSTNNQEASNAMNTEYMHTQHTTHHSQSQTPPPQPETPVRGKGTTGKFTLAIILLVVGGILTIQQLHIEFLDWEKIWPLIPLVFGLRLLRDYTNDRESGQFLLGIIFSFVGFVFILQNWDFGIQPVDWLADHWGILLIALAFLLIWQDYSERRKAQAKSKQNKRQGENQ
ncbi:hypothetical protein GF373_01995 [bacterium]|nr:hypothetical protein [bacterium]